LGFCVEYDRFVFRLKDSGLNVEFEKIKAVFNLKSSDFGVEFEAIEVSLLDPRLFKIGL
jgi:hypothetical protein